MKPNQPTSIADALFDFSKILKKRQKYVKNEFQAYGLQLAEEFNDWKHKSLYIRLAKNTDKKIIETARNFIKDQSPHTIKSKAKLFMWKLKQLKSAKIDSHENSSKKLG